LDRSGSATEQAGDQRHDEQHEEHEEQDLGDLGGADRDSGEPEDRGRSRR
jgi:hypothetical protein